MHIWVTKCNRLRMPYMCAWVRVCVCVWCDVGDVFVVCVYRCTSAFLNIEENSSESLLEWNEAQVPKNNNSVKAAMPLNVLLKPPLWPQRRISGDFNYYYNVLTYKYWMLLTMCVVLRCQLPWGWKAAWGSMRCFRGNCSNKMQLPL